MKKITAILIAVLFAVSGIFAHGVLLLVEQDGNGKIFIEAGLSTGGTAAGAEVIIKEKASGKPILTTAYPETGYLTVEQPTIAYTVTVRLSEGHEVTKSGPVGTAKPAAKAPAPDVSTPAPKPHSHDGVPCTGH